MLSGKPDNRRRAAGGLRVEQSVEVPAGNAEQGSLTTLGLHTHARIVIRCAIKVVAHSQIQGQIGGHLPTVLKKAGVVVLMVVPVLQNGTVLESLEVLLVRREQKEVLRESVNRAGEIGQQVL